MPSSDVIQAIIKSSPVPISTADAQESIDLLKKICPEFLRVFDVGSEEWIEMVVLSGSCAGLGAHGVPSTPTRKGRLADDEEEELRTLSPKRVKKEGFGLREVRERIKRELEATE